MRKLYYKYQVFYLIIAAAFLGYSLFYYIQNSNPEKFSIKESHLIIDKRCSATPRINSFVQIIKHDKIYTVNLPEQECVNHSVGEQITLYYNKRYDYFFYPDRYETYLSRVIISGIAFLLLLLPWRHIRPCIKISDDSNSIF